MLDNIGLPYSGINLSYSNAGTIGTPDAEILVSLKEGHRPTAEYVKLLREELPTAVSLHPILLPARLTSSRRFSISECPRPSTCRSPARTRWRITTWRVNWPTGCAPFREPRTFMCSRRTTTSNTSFFPTYWLGLRIALGASCREQHCLLCASFHGRVMMPNRPMPGRAAADSLALNRGARIRQRHGGRLRRLVGRSRFAAGEWDLRLRMIGRFGDVFRLGFSGPW